LTRALGVADDDRVMAIARGAPRGLVLAMSLVAGCTSPLVASEAGEDDDGTGDEASPSDSGGSQPADDDDGPPGDSDGADDEAGDDTESDAASGVDGDGPGDSGGDDSDTGEPSGCGQPEVPDVRAEVWPGSDPLEYAQIVRELDCVIENRITAGDGVSLHMACSNENGPLPALVTVGVEADAITVPAILAIGTAVRARVYTGRDLDDIEAFPWRRADHFALFRDGALVLGAGAGVSFPSTLEGDPYTEFWSPLAFGVLPSACAGEPRECHDPVRGIFEVASDGTSTVASPFSVLQIGGFEIHFGELVESDTPSCGEPPYKWMSFAIAPA